MVYVLAQDGTPLMPTDRHGKVRHLLACGKAKVVRRCPFTIRLLYETKTYTQPLTLGVDTGSGTAGYSVSGDDGKIFYMSKVILRNDIADKMKQRAKYRRSRRTRKTRYRKARFDNRGNSKRQGRFSPTMTSKLQAHEREIRFVKKILPVTKLVLETGTFDPHLMKNPKMNRHWGYQKGPNYGFANTKAMVLSRDGHQCCLCHGKHKDSRLEVHHIVYRSNNGSDDASNLITLCAACHKAVHEGKAVLKNAGAKKGTLSHATQMNCIRKQLLANHPEAVETFGYVTKENRQTLGLGKDHHLDAGVIASGGKKVTFLTDIVYVKRCVPEGDFQKTKGVRSQQRIETGKICGIRKFDKVMYRGSEYIVKGRMSSGYVFLMDAYGRKADFSYMPQGMKTAKLKDCRRMEARRSWVTMTEAAIRNTA